jgi:hypothetical protein
VDQAQAEQFIVHVIRERPGKGFLDLSRVIEEYIYAHEQEEARERVDSRRNDLSPLFMEAAWDLAVLGVLRPGRKHLLDDRGRQFDGTSYVITDFGSRWATDGTEEPFVPIGSETFIALLQPYTEFGAEFIERAREAARCWKVKAFLACCTMCGAAAEAILLSATIAKTNDRAAILQAYNSKGGRRKVEQLLTGSARAELRETTLPLFALVKYWRDEASHGGASGIGQAEARTSLQSLYLYARLVNRCWSELTSP